jgi:Spy/CpxP family protein refolding chaperone
MRPAILALIIALLTAGASFAQNNNLQQMSRKSRSYSLKSSSFMMGRYSGMLSDMISGALKMDISDEQKAKVSKLRDDYMYPMTKDENELRKADINAMKMLGDPSFDPAKVKEEIAKSDALGKKVSDMYVDALVSLRDTIGKENYAELNKSVTRYRDSLVQMRKNRQPRSMTRGMMKSEPEKTGTPSPAPESKN